MDPEERELSHTSIPSTSSLLTNNLSPPPSIFFITPLSQSSLLSTKFLL